MLILFSLASLTALAQSNPVSEKSVPLNLDDQTIAKELVKESQANKPDNTNLETIRTEPNRLDESFNKAEKHGIVPSTVEINTAGTPQRVTKVTGADGSYCVYSPTVARTDGIDEIQNGLQTQVRTCPP